MIYNEDEKKRAIAIAEILDIYENLCKQPKMQGLQRQNIHTIDNIVEKLARKLKVNIFVWSLRKGHASIMKMHPWPINPEFEIINIIQETHMQNGDEIGHVYVVKNISTFLWDYGTVCPWCRRTFTAHSMPHFCRFYFNFFTVSRSTSHTK